MSAVARPAPFTFDLDLGRAGRRARVLDDVELNRLLDRARAQGNAEGRAAAAADAATRATTAAAEAAEALAAAARQADVLDRALADLRAEAARLALDIAGKLARHLIESAPHAELMALLAECLASLERTPHLVIRCHPDLADRIKADAEARCAELGFQGRLVIMGEPDIAAGDGRIEWADGGVARDSAAVLADIEARIARYTGVPIEPDHPAATPPGDQQ